MKIPKNWILMAKNKSGSSRAKGKELLTKVDSDFYEIDEDKLALNLTKDKFNSFQLKIENWLYDLLKQTYDKFFKNDLGNLCQKRFTPISSRR